MNSPHVDSSGKLIGWLMCSPLRHHGPSLTGTWRSGSRLAAMRKGNILWMVEWKARESRALEGFFSHLISL